MVVSLFMLIVTYKGVIFIIVIAVNTKILYVLYVQLLSISYYQVIIIIIIIIIILYSHSLNHFP